MAELNDESDDEERNLAEAIEDVTAHILHLPIHEKDAPNNDSIHSHLACPDDVSESSAFIATLQDTIVAHALTTTTPKSRYAEKFYGIMIVTGCAKRNTGGILQYELYCETVGQKPNIDDSQAKQCHFGIGSERSKGTAKITLPIRDLWLFFNVHIVTADVPILLCVPHMDNPVKLHRLHRHFGHPHVDKRINLLERSEVNEVTPETRKMLSDIVKPCKTCQTYAQKPRLFRFTLQDDEDFNHTVNADVFYIDSEPVLHIVDESTNYQATKWLTTVSSQSLWRALRLCWIDAYLGPLDAIVHDAGKNFMAEFFASNADLLHIRTKAVPVESASSMKIVECYHQPIRSAYQIIKSDSPHTDKDAALQMSVKAINDAVGPEGLVPTLLVYGALPRLVLPHDKPNPSTFQGAAALRKATDEMTKRFARHQVQSALGT